MTPYDSLSPLPDTSAAQAALNLRPLSLGELLDRAFHLYFKYIAAFSALVAVVIVPSTIISYFQTRGLFDFLITTVQHAGKTNTPPDLSQLNALQPSDTWLALQYALLVLGYPFAYGAIVVAVSHAYLGLPVRFAESYRFALRRWLPILILIVAWFIVAFFLVIALAVLGVMGAAIIGVIVGLVGNNLFFIVGGVIIFTALMVAFVAAVVMLYLTSAMSFIAVVIENVDPIKAIGGAFARMFSGRQFWRGAVLALALTGINIGVSLIAILGGMVAAFVLKSPAIYIIAVQLTSLFFTPFAIVTAAVFYYDVRIRREGYDLQMLVDRFSSATPPVAPGA